MLSYSQGLQISSPNLAAQILSFFSKFDVFFHQYLSKKDLSQFAHDCSIH